MKKEYDFSYAERGRFYRPNARLVPPVHLDPEVIDVLTARAEAEGTTLNDLVNKLLTKSIAQVEPERSNVAT